MKTRTMILGAVALSMGGALVGGARWLKRNAESTKCGNHMLSIGSASRSWAGDHGGHMPSSLLPIAEDADTTWIFVCPGDHHRQPAASVSVFTPSDSSYEIVTPGVPEADTTRVFLRCKIHGHLGYADGTVLVHGRPHHK